MVIVEHEAESFKYERGTDFDISDGTLYIREGSREFVAAHKYWDRVYVPDVVTEDTEASHLFNIEN